jgi:predicted  nucleic acid-binding Zn-ribbon protein
MENYYKDILEKFKKENDETLKNRLLDLENKNLDLNKQITEYKNKIFELNNKISENDLFSKEKITELELELNDLKQNYKNLKYQ